MPSHEANAIAKCARERGLTIAVAESLTGGAVCATLVEGEGASDVIAGAVVAYQLRIKRTVLGVSAASLEDPGPVSDDVALQMARGVRKHLGASVGVATTGAAGPEPHGGAAPGTVHVAVVSDAGEVARGFSFAGDRVQVVRQAHDAALTLLAHVVCDPPRLP